MTCEYKKITPDFISGLRRSLTDFNNEKARMYDFQILKSHLKQCETGLDVTVVLPEGFLLLDSNEVVLCSGNSMEFILGYLQRIADENERLGQKKCPKKKKKSKSK